jgi:thymidylate synthase ThyX
MIEDYEEFTENQLKILNRYVTHTKSNVFALRNLPEVIKGALFSRYSRSSLGLRALLLKEFIMNEETAFANIAGHAVEEVGENLDIDEQIVATRKAQNFYDRILDGYGDDSIGELGGGHLALENISILAANIVEDCRIGGSPLEKSTRYVYFDQKFNGQYLFYREPVIMTSAYRDLYVTTCNTLFETYSRLIPPVTELIEKKLPRDPAVTNSAYMAALRAKVLDCLRGLLPASTLTNMGVYGNGRFFETLIQKLNCSTLAELADIGKKSYQELGKVLPSFIRRAEASHKHQKTFSQFKEKLEADLKAVAHQHDPFLGKMEQSGIKLISYNPDSVYLVAAALLFPHTDVGLLELQEYCRKLPDEEIGRIFEAASRHRENRRHKSPRALEHANFTFEMVTDFGIFRDLHRHRMVTQERQLLTCFLGYEVPEEIQGTSMEVDYRAAMDEAKKTFETIAKELPTEAQYVVPMGYNFHWYLRGNLRSLQWLCELRSAPAGHFGYRFVAQEIAKQVSSHLPQFERFFKFVDFEGYTLGRLDQEIRTDQKKQQRGESLVP